MSLKVTPTNVPSNKSEPKKLSSEEIAQKIRGKFGKEAQIKKAAPKPSPAATAEIRSQETIAHGDVGLNDPKAEETREKLKGMLTGGGFQFNDKERKALAEILK